MTETQTGDRLLGTLPAILQTAVLGESSEMPAGSVPVKGYDLDGKRFAITDGLGAGLMVLTDGAVLLNDRFAKLED